MQSHFSFVTWRYYPSQLKFVDVASRGGTLLPLDDEKLELWHCVPPFLLKKSSWPDSLDLDHTPLEYNLLYLELLPKVVKWINIIIHSSNLWNKSYTLFHLIHKSSSLYQQTKQIGYLKNGTEFVRNWPSWKGYMVKKHKITKRSG